MGLHREFYSSIFVRTQMLTMRLEEISLTR